MKRFWSEKSFPDITVFYRTLAFMWLRYEQGCYLVTFERHPDYKRTNAKPDALGLNSRRRLIEVEIKVSLSDMKNDLTKSHRVNTGWDITRDSPTSASRLYYLVPPHLVADALEVLPTHVGVLSPHPSLHDSHTGFPAVALHRRATALHDHQLPLRLVIDMVRDQSGTMASLLTEMTHLLRHHPELIRNGRLDMDTERTYAAERLPKPGVVTPAAAILDDGSRSGRAVARGDLDPMWRAKPAKVSTTAVPRRAGS